jgi:replicative DNA helicase
LITESFINSCFIVVLNKHAKIKRDKALYRDILDIMAFAENRKTVDIPVTIESKLNCLKKICELLIGDKTIDNVLDSISFSEKFKQHADFLDVRINEQIKDHVVLDCVNQIRLHKKINGLFKNFDDLNKVIDTIKDGSFDSIDDLAIDYEATIKTLYSNMMESNRVVDIEASASLDLTNDDYTHVLDNIVKKYDRSNKTPTGFHFLDDKVLFGGYDPSRLYVWGGASGSGKSTILTNTILYSALPQLSNSTQGDIRKPVPGEIHRVYIYITCENTIDESLMRIYMPMFDRTFPQVLNDIKSGVNIQKKIYEKLTDNSSTIIMKYFPAMTISSFDLMAVVDDVIDQYGKDKIAGLYVDYLDLLKTDTKYDIYRMELGHITLSLKTLAVQYNIPVITATQLGRSAYKITQSAELSVEQISESIKKVEHADFIGLLAKDPISDDIVHGKIGKNRSGKSGISIDLKTDFSRYKYLSITPVSNVKKNDGTKSKKKEGNQCATGALITFDGIDKI